MLLFAFKAFSSLSIRLDVHLRCYVEILSVRMSGFWLIVRIAMCMRLGRCEVYGIEDSFIEVCDVLSALCDKSVNLLGRVVYSVVVGGDFELTLSACAAYV